ncbi:NADPH-dependent 7-cyano-7-deazaguanine reductase QueF [bacterium]|nr:NADPH-dependent 7-cyano-7-deazaguanine reductase QueF [candidate division CSSED10-310 bacterium]
MNHSDSLSLSCESPDHIRTDILQTFPYEGKKQKITYVTREFSAVCPFSGLPDIASVEIVYIPRHVCLELKSLKLYLVSYRSVGIYQEHATHRLFSDIENVLTPEYLKVVTRYATRGGIDAECQIESS